ncbi:hypothetical protein [Spirosoma aerolatum]|uniref:hypothetical protein n=1 Tax=Spirosoma aerolatum TaxID=1211326 RepID=UPI0009ADE613|nr:hypothetical protein [Spirosoma aerolatum]
MIRFLSLLCVGIVFSGLISLSVVGQGIPLPNLSSLPARPLSIDTTISRSEYQKLDLARRTLLALSFSDADQVIAAQQAQLIDCEQAISQLEAKSHSTINRLRDSLQTVKGTIQKTIATTQATTQSVNQAQSKVSNFGSIIRDAKRLGWTARIGALSIGVVVGVLLPPAINLFKNGF